jgi:ribonuclease P protein component
MKINTLKKKTDFDTVYQRGKRFGNRNLNFYYIRNKKQENRVGIVVSKKVGNAVVRNRIRRLIKESYRLNQGTIKVGYDMIVVAKKSCFDKDFKEIEGSLLHILKRKDLMHDETDNDGND